MNETLKVLVVEDVESDFELALRELRQREPTIDFRRVETEEAFHRALDEFWPHVILSDFSMPSGFDGMRALDLAREKAPDVPFIFVSGTIGEDRLSEAMRRGATDYVLKDRLYRLLPVVQRALQEADERAARRRAERWRDGQNRILELIATGVSLSEALRQLVLTVESQDTGMACSVLLLDADGRRLRTGAAPSLPGAYNRAVDGVGIGPAVGSCGTAAYRKQQVIVTDIAADPLWADYRGIAAAHGLCACWATPILSRNGSLLGTFANYFRTPRGPTPEELHLVASASHIARIAVEKRLDELELFTAKERLDLALEASGVALWDNDVASGRVYLSEQWAKLLDHEPRETVTTVPELVQLAHPDDRQMLLDLARDTIRGARASYDAEHRVMTKSGEWKWILSRGKVVERTADGNALRVIGTNVDITPSKLQEQRTARLSRIHSMLSEINSAIVRTRDRQELCGEACRIAVEHGNFALAWIGLIDPSTLEVTPAAWAGAGSEGLEGLTAGARADAPAGAGTIARAIGERRPVCENDLAAHADAGGRPEVQSAISLPLLIDDQVTGTLTLFARDAGFFTAEETKLLTELAEDISFALQSIARLERLDYLSYYDPLTGLPNRTLFIDRTGQQLRARGGETPAVAVVLLNLERFRNINETFGRHGGDELLKQVARRLEEAFRGKDYLARTAADGFGVVMRGLQGAGAVAHAAETQVLASFQRPFLLDGAEVRVAARAGIAMFPADGPDADTLFKNAEAALKKARDSSERYLFYAAEMNARAAQVVLLETRLRQAVEASQFVLHYQPKIALGSGRICGLEALIRWREPGGGLVAPGTFIPVLEETGLILEAGRWVLAQALADYGDWAAAGCQPPRIAVNVSAVQLQQRDFVETVIAAVGHAGNNANALELEVTESLLMRDVEGSIRKLSVLRESGIHITLDDFGTGYSSLSYIARLPINSVKVDRSFINGMASGPQDMAIVTTIIALAHSLNLRVVAEGVETGEQAQLLKVLNCDEAQGFLYGRPVPAAEIRPLLHAQGARPAASRPRPGVKRASGHPTRKRRTS